MRLHYFAIAIFFLNVLSIQAQESISLQECYDWAQDQHPLQEKYDLLTKQNILETEVLNTQKYPQIMFEAQATYQSDVVELPFTLPNMDFGSLDKDQYKAALMVNQVIYNGGLTDHQKLIKSKQLAINQEEVTTQLHTLKTQINQAYFSVLLLQEKISIIKKTQIQLTQKQSEINQMVEEGVLYERAVEPVTLAILELKQNEIELNAQRQLWLKQLGLLTGKSFASDTVLNLPKQSSDDLQPRSELSLIELQKEFTDLQSTLIQKQGLPKISAFGTAGYGKPGLNMLSNVFSDYYLAGIKLQWQVYDFNARNKQIEALKVQKEIIDNQKAQFEWNQNLQAENFLSEIDKLKALLATDDEIIYFRKTMVESAEKKLKHDMITIADLTEEINKLKTAEINKTIHEIQLALAMSNYNNTLYD